MKFHINEAKKIKLIIWDLDETFWGGTLTDENSTVIKNERNCKLVKKLTYRGIVNSICSKNEFKDAEEKLKEFEVNDYFVFKSINWNGKAKRLKNIIEQMALRPENVLFIDDNLFNLNEAEFLIHDLYVAGPEILDELENIVDILGKDDSGCERLKQYKILEKKRGEQEEFESNEEFLTQSKIEIYYEDINNNNEERVYELTCRSNQLNYTKKRIELETFRSVCSDSKYDSKCIYASDKYGDYGIIGFYCLNIEKKKLEHFLFSCRTLGMGIEQFVYSYLNCPELEICGPVAVELKVGLELKKYISIKKDITGIKTNEPLRKSSNKIVKVLLKGPCDLEVMAKYIGDLYGNIDKEFNFIDSNGNHADYFNHSCNVLNSVEEKRDRMKLLCEKYSFLSEEAFETRIFSGYYDVICMSLLMDATLAVYEDRYANRFAFGLYNKPLSDKRFFNEYKDKKVMTACSKFEEKEMELFSQEFRNIDYTSNDIANNIQDIINKVCKKNSNTKFIILLLSELPFESKSGNGYDMEGKERFHRQINLEIMNRLSNQNNIYFLDVNKYVKNSWDYFDNINHYSKKIYFEMAQEFVEILNGLEIGGYSVIRRKMVYWDDIKRRIYKLLFLR